MRFTAIVVALACVAAVQAADRPAGGEGRREKPRNVAEERQERGKERREAAQDKREERRAAAEREEARRRAERQRVAERERAAEGERIAEREQAAKRERVADAQRRPKEQESDRRREGEQKRNDAREDKQERSAEAEGRREQHVDNRQERQGKRIEHGVRNGSLTSDELQKLNDQQQAINSLETSLKSDGKLSRPEFQQLREELDVASRCIFAEKHDAEGKTMPVYRLGRNVQLNNEVAQKLSNPDLSKAEARSFAGDFRQMLHLKHELASGKLSEAQRTQMQARYNQLLNKYFVVVEGK